MNKTFHSISSSNSGGSSQDALEIPFECIGALNNLIIFIAVAKIIVFTFTAKLTKRVSVWWKWKKPSGAPPVHTSERRCVDTTNSCQSAADF